MGQTPRRHVEDAMRRMLALALAATLSAAARADDKPKADAPPAPAEATKAPKADPPKAGTKDPGAAPAPKAAKPEAQKPCEPVKPCPID